MFNPHMHQQQQQQHHHQQQQFQQHLRQLQQIFQQQPPPPPPPPQPPPGHHVSHHHHQTQRSMPGPSQNPPPAARMQMNLCQATQTTIMAPNPMLQGALLMQQMQGNMRSFAMAGQQFRQFFATGTRSSLLGPVPMGMTMKSPMMGYTSRTYHQQHARFYHNSNNSATASASYSSSSSSTADAAARQPDRKRDSEQMAAGSSDDQPAAGSSSSADKTETDVAAAAVDEPTESPEETVEPVVKKKKKTTTEESEESTQPCAESVSITDAELLSSECNSNGTDSQAGDCILLEEGDSALESDVLEENVAAEAHGCLSAPSPSGLLSDDSRQVNLLTEEMPLSKDSAPLDQQEEGEEVEGEVEGEVEVEGANKFYCYLCSITCHNQQNFKSHMNSLSHQQRMMEIQHMSNACLVSLLPRVAETLQETLQGAGKDGEKIADLQRWCATCHSHFSCSIKDHRRTQEHKAASRAVISSCTVCKKHFRTSQVFVEHLQSQEHRQRVEKLQENEESQALAKLSSTDTDGFFLEEEEGSEEEEDQNQTEGDQDPDTQGGWTSSNEVTLQDLASDDQYDPDKVYGSSFFVPVAGFICRLCNKFYHFESAALHTHCKTLQHFNNFKRHRESLTQNREAVESSRESVELQPETITDCSGENSSITGVSESLNQQQETGGKEAEPEPDPTSQNLLSTSETSSKDQHTNLHQEEEEEEHTAPDSQPAAAANEEEEHTAPDSQPAAAANEEEEHTAPDSQPAAAAANEEEEPAAANEEEEDEEEEEEAAAAAAPGKKNGTTKAKNRPKRRSGRPAKRGGKK